MSCLSSVRKEVDKQLESDSQVQPTVDRSSTSLMLIDWVLMGPAPNSLHNN